MSIASDEYKSKCGEYGLLGSIILNSYEPSNNKLYDNNIFLNTSHPFCFVTCGVQGSGKSHTIGVVLENCMIPANDLKECNTLTTPMTGLVFHYDQCPTNRCESTGLITIVERFSKINMKPLPKEKMIVLVSPSYFKQRKQYYGDYCEVRPLLFSWSTLTAKQIKTLMKIDEDGAQLYMSTMLDLLRRYQRDNKIPAFENFIKKVENVLSSNQTSPLKQRITLLQSIIKESSYNSDIKNESIDLYSCMKAGRLIIADMTDPLLSSDDANGIFDVLLAQFRSIEVSCGKVVVLDEAHKYLSSHSDPLTRNLVETVRLMRHEGIRIAISTQSPNVLPHELLELASVAVLHQFHSKDWLTYLKSKLPLDKFMGSNGKQELTLNVIQSLNVGEAFLFSNRYLIKGLECNTECFRVHMRQRFTKNLGASKLN